MENWKFLKRLCDNIVNGRFDDKRYRDRKPYFGVDIQTGPLNCSYGTIGFIVDIYSDKQFRVSHDWEKEEILIDYKDYKTAINILWLKDKGFSPDSDGTELEYYTPSGGDMIIHLQECSKDALLEYMENFDINEEVSLWWPNGDGSKTPFSNMKEHYEDLEEWVKEVKRIAEDMPY